MLMGDTTNSGSEESMASGGLESPERWSAFEVVAGQVVTSGELASLQPRLALERVGAETETLAVTSQYFRLLGQQIRGRDFTRDDNRFGAEPVAIISDRLWSRTGRSRDIIGAVAAARPLPVRIIGIAPPGFQGARRGEDADVWIPSNLAARLAAGGGPSAVLEDSIPCMVFARLHPGQTTLDAKRRFVQDAVGERDRFSMERVAIVPLAEVYGTPNSRSIVIREHGATRVVAGLAGLVLVAGCATLMTLVLVHYERRRREFAVRISLGASRKRLVADLSRELGWLAGAGTATAVLVATWSLRALPALSLPGGVDLSRLDLSIDWRVLVAALSTTALTLVVAALLPMSRFTRRSLVADLVAAGSTTPASSQRLRQMLLMLHVSLTIVVLVSAGLFVRAVIHGFRAGAAFDVNRTLFVDVQVVPLASSATDMTARAAFIAERTQRLTEGLRALPGVNTVATGYLPIGANQARSASAPRAVVTRSERRELRLGVLLGSQELLAALGVPVLKGRALTAADGAARPRPAVVTASLAGTLWPNEEPFGQTLSLSGRFGTFTVVGVSADFAYGSLSQQTTGVIVSVQADSGVQPPFVVHADRPEMLLEPIRKLVKDVVPDVPRLELSTGRDIVARDLGRQRLGAWFFSGFGLIALVLGSGGAFGLVAYLAESRRREFGVRMALGATPRDVVWRGVTAALMPVSMGAAAGLVFAVLVTRVFVSSLIGLSRFDPLTYVSVAMLMVGSPAAAGLAAAWRLRRLAPSEALRAE
jgi:predicted permease